MLYGYVCVSVCLSVPVFEHDFKTLTMILMNHLESP